MGWVKDKGGSKVPVSNGSTRSVKKYAGGGEVGFNSIGNKDALLKKLAAATSGQNPMESIAPPMENTVPPMYKKGGETRKMKEGKGVSFFGGDFFQKGGKERRAKRRLARAEKRHKAGKHVFGKKKRKAIADKEAANKSWSSAVKKNKEVSSTGSSLTTLIKARDKYVAEGNKDSAGYKNVQNRINKAYGSKKRH
tara:strand:- start:209 stop:793 length:585 start_codon:yes stop_codon:yes gene_type:complete